MKEKTLQDYKKMVNKVTEEFKERKMNSGLNFVTKENQYDTSHIFFIANNHFATKIMYDEQIKYIVTREIFMNDVETLLELKHELKGGV